MSHPEPRLEGLTFALSDPIQPSLASNPARHDGAARHAGPKPHILFLFSDTGGGHRAAAEAIIEALQLEFGEAMTTEMVDFFKAYAPGPLRRMPEWYPYMVKIPWLWGLGFYLSNGRRRVRAILGLFWPFVARAARRLVRSHPADLIVTVHPFATTLILHALGPQRPPFVTVVTDMVTAHAFWFDRRADMTVVATPTARDYALANGLDPEQVVVVGQPVAARYCVPPGDKRSLRARLGWPQDAFIAVLVGGGEGMGPLDRVAYAVDESGLDLALVIVAGRNERLKADLEARAWRIPTFIYGFTREMPDFMRAADVLITKAGPGTIAEALNAGVPLILYARLPGQEDGNVDFVVGEGVGVWAPKPQMVVQTLARWIADEAERRRYVENARRVARPDAARAIARILATYLKPMPVSVGIAPSSSDQSQQPRRSAPG